jgi:two-component system, NtrC family, sensor kinase
MGFLHTLTFRVLVASCLLLLTLFGLYTWLAVNHQAGQMATLTLDAASRISDIIKSSTRYSMLLNRSEDVHQIITTIGNEPGVEGVRIYNKRGEIIFSTNKSEESTVVDMKAEACNACHAYEKPLESLPTANRGRIYTVGDHRVVGHINPIRNEPACSNAECHAHSPERTVLGVLDVRMSLARVDEEIALSRRKLVLYGAAVTVIVMVASVVFLFLSVHRPVSRLTVGTHQLAEGNLDYRILAPARDELGELSRAFNKMAISLQEAEREKRNWSETLERRVQEKSDELQQIHEQMLQIEKMASLGKLSATVAHELNNPLEGILTYAKLIRRRLQKQDAQGPAVPQTLEDLDLIIREIQRCGNIVKNLLLFSKKQVSDFGTHSIPEIVAKAVQLMQHHFKISNVQLRQALASDDLSLLCDENQIQQALVALFVNAVEAMPKGGSLTVAADRDSAGNLNLRVADTGAGIAKEDLKRIFEPFFSTKKEIAGVGLGLSVVYGIVERHGGTITVTSEAGKGTEFTMTFPPTELDRPRVEAQSEVTAGGARTSPAV